MDYVKTGPASLRHITDRTWVDPLKRHLANEFMKFGLAPSLTFKDVHLSPSAD